MLRELISKEMFFVINGTAALVSMVLLSFLWSFPKKLERYQKKGDKKVVFNDILVLWSKKDVLTPEGIEIQRRMRRLFIMVFVLLMLLVILLYQWQGGMEYPG